jgi:EmrB/QacA subfamily drug resistance transporter
VSAPGGGRGTQPGRYASRVTPSDVVSPGGTIRYGTPTARWVIAGTVLGSGVAFLDGTVVNVALPAIARDLHAPLTGLQWTLTSYLLTLGALLVLGGSLGDRYGRRKVFVIGLAGFSAASMLCGAAPSTATLVAARAVQGAAAALLVPGSLAIISASFHPDDRGRAIGAWSGLAGVSTAIGPFAGGWLVDAVSWRLVFFVNVPLVAAAVLIALRHVPETRSPEQGPTDWAGAATLSGGLAGVVYALIEGPAKGASLDVIACGALGVLGLLAFVMLERRVVYAMVPLRLFRSRQFSGANAVTLVVYSALSATTFLLVLHLQHDLGYSALAAGASLLPITVLMLTLSARSGALAQRIGPRIPMTVGPVVVACGLLVLSGVGPGSSYLGGVLPGVLVFGAGLTLTVAPLTTAVLAAVDDAHLGVGSAINNAVARVAGLLAVAVLPAAAGIATGSLAGEDLTDGFMRAMLIAAALAASGGALAFATIRRARATHSVAQADLFQGCNDPCLREGQSAA